MRPMLIALMLIALMLPLLICSTGCQQPEPTAPSVSQAWGERQTVEPAAGRAEDSPARIEEDSPTPIQTHPAPDPSRPVSRPAEPTNAPPSGSAAIAFVNGRPLERRAVIETLLRGYGLGVLQQHLLLEVARQAAETAGLTIDGADIEREYDLTIRAAHLDGNDDTVLNPVRRAELIEMWLRRTGVSAVELRIAMTRQAYLRKLAADRVSFGEPALREEYDRLHGDRTEVRHVQLASLRDFDRIGQRLRMGEDFAALAALYSRNRVTAEDGGLLPPFSRNDTRFPATLREAAFQLKPGEYSDPIRYDDSYHVLKLERFHPATHVPFDSVRDELAAGLRERLLAEAMDALGQELLNRAAIRIVDPAMETEYRREQAAGRIVAPPPTR
jgi:hypothetical protein